MLKMACTQNNNILLCEKNLDSCEYTAVDAFSSYSVIYKTHSKAPIKKMLQLFYSSIGDYLNAVNLVCLVKSEKSKW